MPAQPHKDSTFSQKADTIRVSPIDELFEAIDKFRKKMHIADRQESQQ